MPADGAIYDIAERIEQRCFDLLDLCEALRAIRERRGVTTHDYCPITLHERCGDDPPGRDLEEPA